MKLDEKIILIYCICDDCIKYLNYSDDVQCQMNTAEVMTTALTASLFHSGNIFYTIEFLEVHYYIPHMISHSQLYRRWHRIPEEIWKFVLYLLQSLLSNKHEAHEYSVDSFPAPACQPCRSYACKLFKGKDYLGYCKSKKLKYYGLKVHLVVNADGVVVEFSITPASHNDIRAFAMMNLNLERGSIVYADKAYTSYMVEDWLLELDNVKLLPQRRYNLKRQHSFEKEKEIKRKRKIVETSISSIQSSFPKAFQSNTGKGFELKLVMFILAINFRKFFRRIATA